MSDLKPTESELKAAEEAACFCIECPCPDTITSCVTIIATHTRHEGKTAKEWAEYCRPFALGESFKLRERAEAAERELAAIKAHDHILSQRGCVCCVKKGQRITELEAELATVREERDGLALLLVNTDGGCEDLGNTERLKQAIARVKAMRAVLEAAKPILKRYAANNPKWFSLYTGQEQDPLGVHELLAALAQVEGDK